jgi:hypothetical protein
MGNRAVHRIAIGTRTAEINEAGGNATLLNWMS